MKKLFSAWLSRRRRASMRWKIAEILLVCWLIPLAFMIGILGVYLANNHSDMTAENFCEQLEFSSKICVERLDEAIASSRRASYDGDLLAVNQEYRKGNFSYLAASRLYKEYLVERYQKNEAVSSAMLWFADDEDRLYSVYNERVGGGYQEIRSYQETDHLIVKEYAAELGTRTGFLKRGQKLYLIRNLVDSSFIVRGTLVFNLNRLYCFGSLSEYPLAAGVYVWIGDQQLALVPNEKLEAWGRGLPQEKCWESRYYEWLGSRLCVAESRRGDNYQLSTIMMFEEEVTKYPFYGYQYVLAVMVLSLIPMLLLLLHVFRREITNPVAVLSEGARHVEQGELGYQIEETLMNREFSYLRESFNDMSENLKQQFDRIYEEEIALREARIMALQSHINPHFMNNTLEIINWEARLGGNLKISKMIEALSTMLDAAMDRRKRPQVRLAEEMGYVNSYLYITKERLGKRLTIEQELPEELMDCLVPRLILQPVVENAVEHGVVPRVSGVVTIRGCCDERFLYLETVNDGGLTEEDRRRVERLLDPQYNTGGEPAGNLGIANVNQRLRIMYGEPCGLTISEDKNGKVIAKLTMPLQKQGNVLCE